MDDPTAVEPYDTDAAIDRVLQAEAAAREEINLCRRQALAILREARSRAGRISQRTDRRIGKARRIADNALKARLEAIAEQSRALSDPPRITPDMESRLEQAIDRLIREVLD
jgi:vacuolar-type H+-ATPase subunit H